MVGEVIFKLFKRIYKLGIHFYSQGGAIVNLAVGRLRPQISYEVARFRFAYTCPLCEMVIASMGFSKRKFPKYY